MAKATQEQTNIMALLEGLPQEVMDKLGILKNREDAIKFAEAGAAKVQGDHQSEATLQMAGLVERVKAAFPAHSLEDIRTDMPEGRDVVVTVAVGPNGVEVVEDFSRTDGKRDRKGVGASSNGTSRAGISTSRKECVIDGVEYASEKKACEKLSAQYNVANVRHAVAGGPGANHKCRLVVDKIVKTNNLTATFSS